MAQIKKLTAVGLLLALASTSGFAPFEGRTPATHGMQEKHRGAGDQVGPTKATVTPQATEEEKRVMMPLSGGEVAFVAGVTGSSGSGWGAYKALAEPIATSPGFSRLGRALDFVVIIATAAIAGSTWGLTAGVAFLAATASAALVDGGSCVTDKDKIFFGAEIFLFVANVILMLISCVACCRGPARIGQIQSPVDQAKDIDDEAVAEV